MDALQLPSTRRTVPESSIALGGVVLVLAVLAFQDTFAVGRLLAGFGVGFVLAGGSYVVADGGSLVRFAHAFAALVAAPLLFFGGLVGWLGLGAVALVATSIALSRRS